MSTNPRKTSWIIPALLILVWMGGAALRAQPGGPALVWSTYLGGSEDEVKLADLEIDASGHVWIAGTTASNVYTGQVCQPNPEQEQDFFLDAFASRLGPGGDLVRSTCTGEPFFDEWIEDLAVGPTGIVSLAGWYETYEDIEVITAQLRPAGPDNFTYYTGEESDFSFAVTTDRQGRVYLAGASGSHFFADGGFRHDDRVGLYILKRDSAYAFPYLDLFLLPDQDGVPSAISVDEAGNIFVTGSAPEWVFGPPPDVWVLKLDRSGNLLWKATLGGSQGEYSTALKVDTAGRVWVAGWTESPDFPVRGGRPYAGGRDAFLARLAPDGALEASTLLGGSGRDEAGDLALDGRGAPYLAGSTESANFPLVDPLPGICPPGTCGRDAFAAAFDPAGLGLTFSTNLGGSRSDSAFGVAVDPAGAFLWVGGLTNSSDFPTVDAWQPELAGGIDAFVARISLGHAPDCSAAVASPFVIWPPNGKLVPVSILGVTDPDGDQVTLRITGVTQDEPGTGATSSGVGTSTAQVRAERDGKGDGRVYRILFEAVDPSGASCSGEVTVCVPHDRRPGGTCGG